MLSDSQLRPNCLQLLLEGTRRMKLLGFLLLPAGWGIVLSALALLNTEAARTGFVLAGLGVEILGLVIVIRAHMGSEQP